MRVGRFTVTNLNESAKSDKSNEGRISINPEDSVETISKLAKDTKENKEMQTSLLKSTHKEVPPAPLQKQIDIQDSLDSNYNNLVATHQQFLLDYLVKDTQRQEQIQNIIKEILELYDKNARLEIENYHMKEILNRRKG
ncbi:hypothetical protein SteCoe_13583 [Stentor coeruleus]|uniref:Uncharacterized protein n=1 Tax=Stentor coeruleus TaxID=5963 RepID=A0A1R2C853_9CILI|nr:hypothetical protein SteCoe_18833 [Stentor coeruleus]OMJ85187.1 hypothetical protein SteCoe_13583 [Stentor coeruleus]